MPEQLLEGLAIYGGQFNITTVSVGTEEFIFLLAGLICFSLPINLVIPELPREFPLLLVFTTLGSVLLISSANLISLFLSIELQSFAVYVLATLDKHSESGTSSGLLYFLLGALASCLILLGSALLYSLTGCLDLNDLQQFYFNQNSESYIDISIIILVIGLLFKIAAAPFHQ
jgi:NADH-ubiquinone oxidoreductase chain 2